MSRKTTGMFNEEEFDSSIIPSYLSKDCRDIITAAVGLGWKIHISSGNSVTIVSFDERKKYHFSASGRTSNSIPRMRRDLVKFADPQKLLVADSLLGTDDPRVAKVANSLLPHVGDQGTVVDHRPAIEREAQARNEERERHAQQRAAEKQTAIKGQPTPSSMGDRDDEPNSAHQRAVSNGNSPHIVSQGPMRAKAGERVAYDSEVTIERLWSDGHTDYKCVKCDYTTDKRLGVSGHHARMHATGQGTSPRPPAYAAEVPNAQVYAPRQTRIDALAQVLEDALAAAMQDGEKLDTTVIAKTALTWVHEQHRKGTEFSEDVEPKTADEVLNRIRTLLDDGSRLRDQQRLSELEVRVLAAEERADSAERRAEQARDTLRALMELASESYAGEE